MSEQTSQEPTMEEILASIRRIISEDEAPEGGEAPPAEAAAPAPEPEAAPEPAPAQVASEPEIAPEPVVEAPAPAPVVAAAEPAPKVVEPEEEALELTDKVETMGDLDIVAAAAPGPRPAEALVSEPTALAASSAFGALSAAIAMPRGDRTLEDVVRELLRPLLQQWLDENLHTIVQQAVDAEVERISRSRVR